MVGFLLVCGIMPTNQRDETLNIITDTRQYRLLVLPEILVRVKGTIRIQQESGWGNIAKFISAADAMSTQK
jgi:hypothetical protein